jgi:hypothetical protein
MLLKAHQELRNGVRVVVLKIVPFKNYYLLLKAIIGVILYNKILLKNVAFE